MTEKLMTNSELLKSSRKKLGWTQQDLADYFEISQREIISYWEQGKRLIPDEVLKMAKQAKRMSKRDAIRRFKLKSPNCKKELSNRVKSVTFIPDEKKRVGMTSQDSSLLHSLEEKITQKVGVCDFSEKYPEGSMEHHILDAYIGFKEINKRFPVETDFINGEFREAEKEEVLQHLGSLSNAKRLAGELKRHKSAEQRGEKIIRMFPSPEGTVRPPLGDKGFLCPCCGRKWRGINDFYNALRRVTKERLSHIGRNSESYQVAVLRLMAFLFGTQEVKKLGYDVTELENNDTCFCGGQFKPDWCSSFKIIITNRLLNLFQSADSQDPEETIEDCTIAMFGKGENLWVRRLT